MSLRSKRDLPAGLYENDDHREYGDARVDEMSRHTGVNVKGYLPKDKEKGMNRLIEEETEKARVEAMKNDPTRAANFHGNQPAKGATIDKELMEEDRKKVEEKNNRRKMQEEMQKKMEEEKADGLPRNLKYARERVEEERDVWFAP